MSKTYSYIQLKITLLITSSILKKNEGLLLSTSYNYIQGPGRHKDTEGSVPYDKKTWTVMYRIEGMSGERRQKLIKSDEVEHHDIFSEI